MTSRSRCVLLFAGQGAHSGHCSRWTQMFAVVFSALALAVAWSGYILSGGSGVQDFARTSASLVQLVILLVPLASLVIGVLSLSSDRGAAEILFSQPVSRGVILFGQAAGVFIAARGSGGDRLRSGGSGGLLARRSRRGR